MQSILTRYSNLPGNGDLVFKSLCALVSEQPNGVDWAEFNRQDWELFEKMAVNEGVAAMSYYLLRTKSKEYHLADFDSHAYQVLSEWEAVNAIRNAILIRHLELILHTLREHDIPVVLLKGADLTQSLYPEAGLRRMTDMDLLVKKMQFEQGLTLINSLGYHEYLPEAFPGLDRLISPHAHLIKEGRFLVLLELHWSLIGTEAFRYAVPMAWFWQNLEPGHQWEEIITADNQNNVYALNPTANLLYLAAHQMLQHGGKSVSLQWLLDIHRLVRYRGDKIEWTALIQQANLFGWSGALGAALEAAQTCFALALPEGLLSTLQTQKSTNDALVILKAEQAPTRILGEWKKLSSLNWQGRIRLMIALIVPSPAYMHWRYRPQPEWIWPFYYLYRWFDIALDGGKTVLRMLHLTIIKSRH